jgi:hypothetical protein
MPAVKLNSAGTKVGTDAILETLGAPTRVRLVWDLSSFKANVLILITRDVMQFGVGQWRISVPARSMYNKTAISSQRSGCTNKQHNKTHSVSFSLQANYTD